MVALREQGKPLFEAAGLEPLLNKSASAFLRLQDAILALSGLTEESCKGLGKNLLSGPTARPIPNSRDARPDRGRTGTDHMIYPEFIEWIACFQSESGGTPPVLAWQKMMQSMRLVSELQRARG